MQRPMAVGGLKYPHLTRGTNLSQSFPGTQENGLSQGMTTPTHGPLQIPSTNLTFTNPLGQLDLSTNSLLVNGVYLDYLMIYTLNIYIGSYF